MINVKLCATTLAMALMLTTYATSARAAESADNTEVTEAYDAATTQTNHARDVLVVPGKDCREASFVLAKVTRHIRDAERSAWFSPEAEDEYDEALQAIIGARCAEGIEELRAADRSIRQSPSADFFIPFDDGR